MFLTDENKIFSWPKAAMSLLYVWQALTILLVIFGILQPWAVWIVLILGLLYIAIFPEFYSLMFLIVSIPFYLAIPNQRFDTLSIWRIWFAFIFLVWFFRFTIRFYRKEKKINLRKIWSEIYFMPWDKALGLFFFIAVILVPFSKFAVPSLKQLMFILNAYFIYVVLVNTIKTKEQIISAVRFAIISLGTIVLVGYIQLISTFFTSFDTFWVYWASFISKLYYGQNLASVLLYSNSWFSYNGARELRMFSIMPDSHSFAVISVFLISFLLSLTYFYAKRDRYMLWTVVRTTGLAVILSGTRGVWAGMAAPFLATIFMITKNYFRPIAEKIFWSLAMILLFFAMAPAFNKAFDFMRVRSFKENFLDRAKTMYDVSEDSNQARIEIWKHSIRYAVSHPVGVGFGNFLVSISSDTNQKTFSELSQVNNKRYNLPQKYVTAHNLYLNVLVELGVFGLAAFLWFWWKYFKTVWDFMVRFRDQDNFYMFFVIVSALTFLWLLAYGLFDVTLFNDKVLMYSFISLGLSGIIITRYRDLKK